MRFQINVIQMPAIIALQPTIQHALGTVKRTSFMTIILFYIIALHLFFVKLLCCTKSRLGRQNTTHVSIEKLSKMNKKK
jgi:hypothetical protein